MAPQFAGSHIPGFCVTRPGALAGECVTQASSHPHACVLETRDLDQAASLLRQSAIPYVSELLPGSPAFSTRISITEGQRVSISHVVTNGTMRVRSCLPAESFALVLDLGGNGLGMHRTIGESISVDPGVAFVQSPLQNVEVLTTPRYEALFVRFLRDAVVNELENMMGRETHSALRFTPALRLQSAAGQRLRALCRELRRTLCSTDSQNGGNSLPVRKLEDDVITLLLQAQSHNYTRLLNRQHGAGRYQLDTAEQFMCANAHLPLSLGDICQAAGVNARTLQHSFRRKRGCTPMQFLRNIRMEEVRAGLLQPTERTSVSGEAARWGFLHFGRFSNEYRHRFGELPSETLRHARNRQ